MASEQSRIDALFAASTLNDIARALADDESDFAAPAARALNRNAPLSMACALTLIARVRATPTIRAALTQEYRFTTRASEHGDFLEGIRAAIIDKDRKPQWKHGLCDVTDADIGAMMAPLGDNELTWKDTP